ncbi:tyrosine-type recombinase/integrase [Acidovorax sp. LjRoot118]|uniref:tyrosine-type recombinase/integrase n=1 Tax=Acidovorax sp. LjRoot118 TaxID=3342256 RepID=UPI003ECD0126
MADSRAINYKLKSSQLNAAKPRDKPYLLLDGGGLYVEVLATGSKIWRYIYSFEGRRPKWTIGPYPEIGIAEARDAHALLRAKLAKGIDPVEERKRSEQTDADAKRRSVTFADFAQVWVRETLFYRSAAYRTQVVRFLDSYINPGIGQKALHQVKAGDVLAIMEKLLHVPVTADRCRVIVQQVYNFAIRKLIVESNPALAVRGAVAVPPAKHHVHLREPELVRFWGELDKQSGTSALTVYAARLLAYTMVRKSELIKAKWPEVDWKKGVWTVPAERMKMRREHRVYLSRQAVALLRDLHRMTGHGEYLFPMRFLGGKGRPMSDATLNHMIGRLDFGVPEFAPHGLRSTAATILKEHRVVQQDVIELLLSHEEKKEVVAAYTRAELADDRRRALQWYADHIDALTAAARSPAAPADPARPAA